MRTRNSNNSIDWGSAITNQHGADAEIYKDLGPDEKYRYVIRIGRNKALHYCDDTGRDLMGVKRVANNIRVEKQSGYVRKKNGYAERIKYLETRLDTLEAKLGLKRMWRGDPDYEVGK